MCKLPPSNSQPNWLRTDCEQVAKPHYHQDKDSPCPVNNEYGKPSTPRWERPSSPDMPKPSFLQKGIALLVDMQMALTSLDEFVSDEYNEFDEDEKFERPRKIFMKNTAVPEDEHDEIKSMIGTLSSLDEFVFDEVNEFHEDEKFERPRKIIMKTAVAEDERDEISSILRDLRSGLESQSGLGSPAGSNTRRPTARRKRPLPMLPKKKGQCAETRKAGKDYVLHHHIQV